MARRIRIAVSVFFGVLTVALCVLWVRSYWVVEGVSYRTAKGNLTGLGIKAGFAYLIHVKTAAEYPQLRRAGLPDNTWRYGTREINPFMQRSDWSLRSGNIRTFAPLWLLAAAVGGIATAVYHFDRFSLRTLLIATTLVAVVLGLAVWAGP